MRGIVGKITQCQYARGPPEPLLCDAKRGPQCTTSSCSHCCVVIIYIIYTRSSGLATTKLQLAIRHSQKQSSSNAKSPHLGAVL